MDSADSSPFCEWLFEVITPSLYAKIKQDGHKNLLDFLNKITEFNSLISKINVSQLSNQTVNMQAHALFPSPFCVPGAKNDVSGVFNTSAVNLTQHHAIFNEQQQANYLSNCYLVNYTADLHNYLNTCNQIESNMFYFKWLFNICAPLLTTLFLTLFLLPALVVIFLYTISIYLFLSKHWNKLKAAYYSNNIWQASYKSIAVFWETQGAIWHGHEVIGMENLPDTGPALLIYYHGAMPIDFYYVHSKTVLYKNRRIKIVADRFLFKVPGLSSLLEAFEVTPGSLDACISLLKEGHILAISPGGVREALFSDHNYELIWGSRCGFAKVATTAKVPVIPMFTQNCREALRTLPYFRRLLRFIYEKTRLPLVPIYGMFPVKLRTFIGKPIEYDPNRTSEELKELTQQRIEELIKKHQRLPGSIFQALLDRFRKEKYD